MASKLSLYNAALRHLGAVRLLNITEDRGDRRELDAVWSDAQQHMLGEGAWKFALRTVELTADTDLDVGFGTLTSAFAMPDDFVRLAGFSTDENFVSEIGYQQQGAVWYVGQSPAYVRYVSNDPALGLNLGLYPSNFTNAFGAWLAYETAMPITKSKEDKDRCFAYYNKFLARAKELEAVADQVQSVPQGKWARARTFGHHNASFPVPGMMKIRG
jgi:hypothetical protein